MIKKPKPLTNDEPSLKDEFKDQFKKKKETQKQAKERRKFIRELREDRDWS